MYICSLAHQKAQGFGTTVSITAGQMERRVATPGFGVDIYSFADQKAHIFRTAVPASAKKRCPSIFILVINIGAILDKSFCFVEFSVFESLQELLVQSAHDDGDDIEETVGQTSGQSIQTEVMIIV
jgi:hypothetical protein